MKQTRKRIGSLLLSVCMVLTMLPTVAFAEEGVQDSGTPSSTSEITAFEDLAESVSSQEVESGTSGDELDLPNTLTATVTTSSATTVTENVYSITVSGWTSNPEYNPDYDLEGTNSYVFTPTLDLPEGVTLANGVEPPTITITVTIDTSGLVETIQNAGLIATVNGDTVTVTGTASGNSKITLDIGEGVTVVWDATYTSNISNVSALLIKGTGTFRIIGGVLTGGTDVPTMFVSYDSPLVVIDGGENTLDSGPLFIYWTAPGGRLVYLSGSIDGKIIKNPASSSSVIAYYSEETLISKFSSWTKGSNLLPLKDVVLTKSDGNAYSYESGTAFVGTVTAMLPDVFDLSSATITPSGSTTSDCTVTINGNSVIFSGTLNAGDLTLTVSGATVGGVPIDTFTTPAFGVNITPFIPVTDITGVPATLEGEESLQLSGTVTPINATKQEIVWSIKDEGDTGASITDSMLSATHTGTVTVTATIKDGITYGTDYTQDFNIDVMTSAALSITPVSCTFDPLEEGYGNASPKTITVTNTGNITLTGLDLKFIGEDGVWYMYDVAGLPSSLAPNVSAQITITPYSLLSVGTYKSTLIISSDQGVEASVPISLTVTEMAPRLIFGGTDVHKLDADFSDTGYGWNAGTKTLTLTSGYAAGSIDFMYCDAETMTLKLVGDVTIDEHAASQSSCIDSSGNLTIDLGGHTLTLMTGGDNDSALDGDALIIQNGTLVARLIGSDTEYGTPSIDAGFLTVGNATVTADADSLDYGGIYIYYGSMILKQGAKLRTCGATGLYFHDTNEADSFDLESDDVSLMAIGSTYAIWLDGDLSYPPGSALRSWTNTDITPPSFTDAGTLLSSKTRDEWGELWFNSKYVYIGTNTPEAVITGISVKSNPSKLIYNEGNKLDLTGLAATLTYSDATTKEVPYTAFAANNITTTYADGGVVAQGDTLSTAQNGKAIILTVGSYTAQTNALTVNAISKYSVTVNNGTGSGEYAEGTTVTMTANTPDSGKQFKKWEVISGGIMLTDSVASTTTFTMPANAVEINATYEDISTASPVTGELYIGGIGMGGEFVSDLTQDASGTGWSWDTSTATLTLTEDIGGNGGIDFDATGDVTVMVSRDVDASFLRHNDGSAGKLTINGSETLNLTYPYNDFHSAISAMKGLEITGTTVNVSTAGSYCHAIVVSQGNFTMTSGTLNLCTTGDNASGIYCTSDNILISGTAEVKTTPSVAGDGLYAGGYIEITGGKVDVTSTANSGIIASGEVRISGGSVAAKGARSFGADGVAVTGGTFITGTAGASSVNGNVGSDLTISGDDTQVTVNGDITNGGSLTVSGGNVTVTGTISGSQNLTGGIVYVNGSKVYPQAPTYRIIINNGTASPATAAEGETVTITANTPPQGQWFKEWTVVNGGVTLANARTASTTFTMPAGAVEVTATYTSGGGSSSGGSSSDGSSKKTITITEKQPNQPITAVASVTATVGANGTSSVSITDTAVTDAISKAQVEAKKQGKAANGVSVELNVTMPKGANSLTVTLTQNSLNSLVSAGVTNLTINGSPVTVTFNQKASKEIQKQSSGNVNITIAPQANLSEAAKRMVGSRPVYNITVGYGNNRMVSNFGGVVTVAIPYTPANGEAIGGLYAVYVDEKGNATRMPGSAYDANSGCVIFTTTHFSMYGVGYTAPSAKFTDIRTHWAKESIDYVVGRGLLSGTSETTFAPNTAMTRGMLVTALGRQAGVDVRSYTKSSFTDVKAGSTFQPYIEWAYKKGIIQGIGNNQFAPDRAIIREEIAVIVANFAKATDYTLPVTREATTYADASSIGSIYKMAVTAMQQAGIMMGGTSNKFNPKSNATRAEVSSMLHRYIKLTIDPDTAQGWALNDAGQWLYYKEGKALTSTQIIDGLKYFFYSNGTLQTGWVNDGDNWRYYSGNKAPVGWYDIGANGNNKTYYFNKDGMMVSGKWLEIDGKWYYFNADGSLAKSTKIGSYEVDENGVRKTK